MSKSRSILRGQTLSFAKNPFDGDAAGSIDHCEDGAVLIEDGRIRAVGPATEILTQNKGVAAANYGDHLIMAGFVDAHIHYPQVDIIGSHSAGLVEWLNEHTFPCETQFDDEKRAKGAAEFFLDQCFANGVTSASVYCTVHLQSVTSFFETASRKNACMAAGKVCMDRNAPANLSDTVQSAYEDTKTLIETWHGQGRNIYAITPRFALSSSPEQLEALGALWKEHPDVLLQTHLSETQDEIAQVLAAHPSFKSYYEIYEAFGLTGPGAIFGHCIHISDKERKAISDSGAAIAHCPTSNAFMGSGHFDLAATHTAGPNITIALASDIGAGTSFSPFATMRAAFDAARHHGNTLHPAEAFWMATCGGAKAMRCDDRIGNLAPGMDADIIVLDLKSNPLLSRRVEQANDIYDILFAQMILADERAVKATYIAGELVYAHSNIA